MTRQRRCIAVACALPMLASCSGFGTPKTLASNTYVTPGRPTVSDSEIDRYIDSSLPVHDKSIMHDVMLHLRKTGRFNVLFYAADGRNYSNRAALRDAMRRAVEVSPGRYLDQAGRIISGPPDDPLGFPGGRTPRWQPPANSGAGTGAFRRVVSPSGFSSVQSDVTVPCGNENYAFPTVEGGYEMLGGWSAISRQSVDAGLQHIQAGQLSEPTENLAVFIKYQNGQVRNGSYYLYTDPGTLRDIYQKGYGAHFPCGQTVTVAFYVSPNGYLNVEGDGNVVADSSYQQVTAVYQVPSTYDPNPEADWPSNGGGSEGIVVKRFTGLAQNGGQNNSSQSYEGISNGNPTIKWNSTYLAAGTGSPSVYWTEAAFPGTRYDTYPCSNMVKYAPLAGGVDKSFGEFEGVIMNGTCP